jgi:N-acylglucosamine-6-phosphate 2-epimerase
MKPGLIVSIQGYSLTTAQELAEHALDGGAVGIRADQPIRVRVPVIGLVKIPDEEYYITPYYENVMAIAEWADIVAIDCRKGNPELMPLLKRVTKHDVIFLADIQTIHDYTNLITHEIYPDYVATTFSFMNRYDGKIDIELLKHLVKIRKTGIIAEGGITTPYEINDIRSQGVTNYCIGGEISKIREKTFYYSNVPEVTVC